MATVKVDNSNFQAEVLDSTQPVVVDFWAEWCGPCKMIGPSLEEISNELAGRVKVAKLNIDENPELAAKFGVRSIPTLAMFKGGRSGRHQGRRCSEDSAFGLDFRRRLSPYPFRSFEARPPRRAFSFRRGSVVGKHVADEIERAADQDARRRGIRKLAACDFHQRLLNRSYRLGDQSRIKG